MNLGCVDVWFVKFVVLVVFILRCSYGAVIQ